MNTKRMLFILFVTLCVAHVLAACGTPATPAVATLVPTKTPPPAPTATPEPADPAAIAQDFYKAVNEGNLDAAMALVAEDIKCRGGCYLTGKDRFRFYLQGSINVGGRTEISDLKVEGDQVTYTWEAYSDAGFFQARGVETLQIEDGLIILIESVAQ